MNYKLILCFLGGAGGNFVSNMLYQLQKQPLEHNDVHFHKSPKSRDVYLVHTFGKDCKYFVGRYKFNQYINCMYKYDINDQAINTLSENEQLEIYSQAAKFSIQFPLDTIDINYDDILINEKKFVNDCFSMFDSVGILYKKDYSLAMSCVENFKKTCIDPKIDFNNNESLLWLGWCMALESVLSHEVPIFYSKQEAQEYLYNKRDLFSEITEKFKMVYFDV